MMIIKLIRIQYYDPYDQQKYQMKNHRQKNRLVNRDFRVNHFR